MPIIACIFLGLIAGYIAHWLSKSTGNGVLLDLGLGVAGAAALLTTFHGLRDTRYRRGDPI